MQAHLTDKQVTQVVETAWLEYTVRCTPDHVRDVDERNRWSKSNPYGLAGVAVAASIEKVRGV